MHYQKFSRTKLLHRQVHRNCIIHHKLFALCLYNRKAEVERDEENKTRIFRDKMLDDRPQLLFNYRNLMLLNGEKWDSEERMDIAFRL